MWETEGDKGNDTPITPLARANPLAHLQILRSAYDLSPVASVSFDHNGGILLANKKFFDLLGIPESHQVTTTNLYHTEYKRREPPSALHTAVQLAKKNGHWEGEIDLCHYQHPQDSTLPLMQWDVVPLPLHTRLDASQHVGDNNTPISVLCGTFHRAPNPTRPPHPPSTNTPTNEMDLKITHALPVGMCTWQCHVDDKQGPLFRLESINPLAERVLGITIPVGSYLHEVVDLDDNPGVRDFFWDIVNQQQTVYHPKFTLGYGQFSLTAFPLQPSALGLLLEPCRTDDPARDALFSLDQSMTAFCLVDGNISDPLCVTYGNFGFLNLTGYKSEEVLGKPLSNLFDRSAASGELVDQIRGGESTHAHALLKNKIKEPFAVGVFFFPMQNVTNSGRKGLLVFQPRRDPGATTLSIEKGSLFQEIFEALDTCAMILSLEDGAASSSSQCRLVALNRKAQTLHFVQHHERTRKGSGVYMSDLFPHLADSGIYEIFQEVLATNTPRYIGVVPFHTGDPSFSEGNFVTKVLPIQNNRGRFVLVLFEDTKNTQAAPLHSASSDKATSAFRDASSTSVRGSSALPGMGGDGNPRKRSRHSYQEGLENLRAAVSAASAKEGFSPSLFREIVDDATQPVILLDMEGYIQYANMAFAQLLGFKSSMEMTDRQLVHLLEHPLEIEYVVGLFRRFALAEVSQFSMDLQYRGQLRNGIACSSKFKVTSPRSDSSGKSHIVLTVKQV